MKKYNIYVTACWFSFLLTILWAVSSCRSAMAVPVKEVTTETVIETVHDTVFETVADSSAYRALLECQNGKVVIREVQNASAGKYLKAPKLTIKDNIADCDCEAQAQKLYAQWKSKNVAKATIKEVPVYIPAQLSYWDKLQMFIGKILLIILIPLILYAAYWLYKKFKR